MNAFEIVENEPDLNVVVDAAARARIWASGLPWRIVHRPSEIIMLLCPEGEFWMGSQAGDWGSADDETRHSRVIRLPFYLSQTAVTQAQWLRIAGRNPSFFHGEPGLPVEQVSWHDCQEALRRVEGSLRLPSEAEWEYACRAGTSSAYSFGTVVDENQVWFGRWNGPTPCGSLPANPWGFHEMHGNLWEWCEDPYTAYPADRGTEAAAASIGTRIRVLRGGGWLNHATSCRSAKRCCSAATSRFNGIGLRVARTAAALFS